LATSSKAIATTVPALLDHGQLGDGSEYDWPSGPG
jgi:hypothetical protein